MTQLTLNCRSPSSPRQQVHRIPSPTPGSPSEGNDQGIWMARVRRNSQSGRSRRHIPEQFEPQRNIRPKASTNEPQLQGGQDFMHHNAPAVGQTITYRGIPPPPPPPQLITAPWASSQNAYLDNRATENLGSPGSSTQGYGVQESPSFASVDRHTTHSPLEYTPTHSVSSFDRSASQDGLTAFLTSPIRTDSGSTGFVERNLHHGSSEPLAGIDAICDSDSNDWVLPKINDPNAVNSPSMMLPSALQHVRDLEEPWSPLELEDGGIFNLPTSPRPHAQASRFTDHQASTLRMSNRGTTRPGRRHGPLSHESRQNANDVRKERSCLRCFVYKETCDTSKDVCQNCSNKQARTWRLGCVRPRLMFRTNYLLPDVLASRLERKYVDSFIQHKGWVCRDKPRFALPLDIGLGPPLVIPVREFLPIGDLARPAYLPIENGKESTAVPITMYDLPVVISCDKEEEAANHIRHSLLKWFQQTIDYTHDNEWAWCWFNKRSETFAGNVMKVICDYFKSDIVQHRVLKEALALSFFNYIFIYSFNVEEQHIPMLQSRLEVQIPKDAQYVSPSIINLYCKMLAMPALKDVVKRTLKGLELLLLDQQNARTWRRDLIFCVAFIVLAYLGRTQVSILQFANQPAKDSGNILTHQAAVQKVMEMEREVCDLVIAYHSQFLTPSPRRKASSAVATEAEQVCEEHATQFKFMEKIKKLKAEHRKSMPKSLEPNCDHVGDFVAQNTARICWKLINAIVPDTETQKIPDTDADMAM